MKNKSLTLSLALLIFSLPALAQPRFYVGLAEGIACASQWDVTHAYSAHDINHYLAYHSLECSINESPRLAGCRGCMVLEKSTVRMLPLQAASRLYKMPRGNHARFRIPGTHSYTPEVAFVEATPEFDGGEYHVTDLWMRWHDIKHKRWVTKSEYLSTP